jgi:hypothetical protein
MYVLYNIQYFAILHYLLPFIECLTICLLEDQDIGGVNGMDAKNLHPFVPNFVGN